ncbi:hypothetical protein BOSP111201_10460 [Bordetella sputigena]
MPKDQCDTRTAEYAGNDTADMHGCLRRRRDRLAAGLAAVAARAGRSGHPAGSGHRGAAAGKPPSKRRK